MWCGSSISGNRESFLKTANRRCLSAGAWCFPLSLERKFMAFYGARPQLTPDRPSVWARLDALLRCLVPGGLTLVLVLMSVAPSSLPGFVHVVPMVVLISVYYWTVTRPGAIGYLVAFLLGIVEDALTGVPMGTNAAILLLLQALIASQYRFFLGRSFWVNWWGFFFVVIGASVLKWGIVSAVYLHPMDVQALAFCALLTVAIYPLFAWIFGWIAHLVYRGGPT